MPIVKHYRLTRSAALALALGALAAPTAAAQSPVPDPPVASEPIDPAASAALEWSVPKRYDASWQAWRPGTATYDPDVVTPKRWSITLDACGSTAERRIERYTFVITGITVPTYKRTLDGKPCKRVLRHVLPGLGRYRVEVTGHTALGASTTLRRIVELRDYLIVSIGDSLASGEGVPDRPGKYRVPLRRALRRQFRPVQITPVQWKDRRCHRSAHGGHALAASAIEDASRHTSVTFVSFSCSGARLEHLYDARYAGFDPVGSTDLPPQLDAVKELVGPRAARGEREIDALLVAAGINDLGFSSIVRACATNNNRRVGHTDCVTGSAASKTVNTKLPGRYDELAAAVRRHVPQVREIYLSGYPSQVFRGGGCGLLGVEGIGIDTAEGEAMNTLGIALNNQVQSAVRRHREEGWNYIEDLTLPFAPHAYCADDSWFNRLESSLGGQGDEGGTAHPNRAGHRTLADLLDRSIVPDQPRTPFRDATLTIDAVKLPAIGTGNERQIEMTLVQHQRDFTGLTRTISVPLDGKWTPVPAELGTFAVPVFRQPAAPRHATEVLLVLDRRLPIHHGFADGYGAGAHELTHPTGHLAVRYHIDVRGPNGGSPETQPTAR